jgi:hypothetical protein
MGEWFAVRAKAGAEERAAIGIDAAGMETFLPVELIRMNHRGNRLGDRAVMWRPLFPRHLFVTLDPSRDLPRLRKIDGVDDVVRPGGRLAPVAGDVINVIRRAERDDSTAPPAPGWLMARRGRRTSGSPAWWQKSNRRAGRKSGRDC